MALHNEFQPAGFEIVASPCDQFGHQEPGTFVVATPFSVKIVRCSATSRFSDMG